MLLPFPSQRHGVDAISAVWKRNVRQSRLDVTRGGIVYSPDRHLGRMITAVSIASEHDRPGEC